MLKLLFVFLFSVATFPSALLKQTSSLFYLVKHPKVENNKTPLLILLHGVGSNETDLFSLANQLPEKYLVVSARAPINLGKDSYGWYHIDFSNGKPMYNNNEAESSRQTIIKFIEELKKKFSFNHQEIYLCGFSQGGIMAYSVGLTRPDLVKGIAVMSGRLLDETKPLINKEKAKTLKIHISHGTQDPVLKIQYAREANAYLKTLGLNPAYHEYQDVHTINAQMLSDLITWLK